MHDYPGSAESQLGTRTRKLSIWESSMNRIGNNVRFFLAGLICLVSFFGAAEEWRTEHRFGGCGGVYFMAQPGELWVELEKADLNRSDKKTHLRAILVGPDRRVVAEQTLPDDGQGKGAGVGPVQRMRFSVNVPSPGIYALCVVVSEDRYGEHIMWGFRTNCGKYLVETSRGHKDAAHEEPLVMLNEDAPGDVCFMPRRGAFDVELSGLPDDMKALTLHNATGKLLAEIKASDGKASHSFPAAERAETPWRLHFPKFKGVAHIDGVTRWNKVSGSAFKTNTQGDRKEDFPDLSLWTPDIDSWFDFHGNRWLLTPNNHTLYTEDKKEGSTTFRVHNNGLALKKIALALEFPEGDAWPIELSVQDLELGMGESMPVSIHFTVPDGGSALTFRLRATPSDGSGVTTYSTIELRTGKAPAGETLDMPLVLKPYEHENQQFGYAPDYPLTNEVYFDNSNQPVISNDTGVFYQRDGQWRNTVAFGKVKLQTSKIAFDGDNDMYTLATRDGNPAYLRSQDGGKTFSAHTVPGKGGLIMEQFSGHNTPDAPPAFARVTLTEKDKKLFWRWLHDLDLFLPKKAQDGSIIIGDPIPITKKCIGVSEHSGIPSSMVSRASMVHIAWGEATEAEEKAPGVPTYVATYDRETKTLSAPALVGFGPPANDVHNTPCITIDSKGYLHVLIGTHGRTFRYARSMHANDASGGWTQAEDIGPGLRQTYVGLVCDQNDTLHTVFRLWRTDTQYFPASHYATLAYMSKPADGEWSQPKALIVAPFSEYSVFYHRLTIDRKGSLYLSYDYWSTFWFYRTDHFGKRRALMMSPDQGKNWRMADFAE
jgi:hypothetical protein